MNNCVFDFCAHCSVEGESGSASTYPSLTPERVQGQFCQRKQHCPTLICYCSLVTCGWTLKLVGKLSQRWAFLFLRWLSMRKQKALLNLFVPNILSSRILPPLGLLLCQAEKSEQSMAKCCPLFPWCEAPGTFPPASNLPCCPVIIVIMSEKCQQPHHSKMLNK